MISRRTTGLIILLWTLVSWGSRVGLLTGTDAADAGSWFRIGGSLFIGLLTAGAFFSSRGVRPLGWVFAVWTTAVWTRSSVTVWAEPNTTSFRLVHTGLAIVWCLLVVLAIRKGQGTGAATGAEDPGVPGGTIAASRDTTSPIDR